jgi:hypothetical protein
LDGYKDSIANQFIKVGYNQYLSKDDPKFLEKYIKYFPNDDEKLYEYGLELAAKGRKDAAIRAFQKSLRLGCIAAEARIKELKTSFEPEVEVEKPKQKSWMIPFLALLNFLVFTSLILFFSNLFFGGPHLFSIPAHQEEKQAATDEISDGSSINNEQEDDPLFIFVLQSGLEQYKQNYGVYPNSIDQLFNVSKDNWLSEFRYYFDYVKEGREYVIRWEGNEYRSLQKDEAIALIHFSATNELGVFKGDELLAIYSVASGKSSLPFEASEVTNRVVHPNGGSGPLGTRGLALESNYAIHGTNDETTIGKNVSSGCLRMKNEEIEILYAYIPLGTSFKVSKNPPNEKPKFQNGLPPLATNNESLLKNETALDITYTWKN